MKIGMIGAGNIGGTLGRKWASGGYEVRFGVRRPEDTKWNDLRRIGKMDTVEGAVASSEVVVLALPGSAVAEFASAQAGALQGKTIIDATNNVRSAVMNSLAILAEKIPTARLVRAFSTLGWENFTEPLIDGVQIDVFFCGNPDARLTAEELIAAMGLRPIYIGDVDMASALDEMTRVWFALAMGQRYGRHIAFKLLTEGQTKS